MEHSKFWSILYLSFFIIVFTSCDNDTKYDPIELVGVEDTSAFKWNAENSIIHLSPFNTEEYAFKIIGGDGKYTIRDGSDPDEIVTMRYNGGILTIKAKGIGYTIFTIMDESQNSLMLRVEVKYPSSSFVVSNATASYVEGGNLTVNEMKEIKENMKPYYPVKSSGGFKFIYTTANQTEGKIQIYPERMGSGQFIEGTFTVTREEMEKEEYTIGYYRYDIDTEDGSYTLYQTPYYNVFTRQRDLGPVNNYMFWEDQTLYYKEIYPAVEKAFIVHIAMYVSE